MSRQKFIKDKIEKAGIADINRETIFVCISNKLIVGLQLDEIK